MYHFSRGCIRKVISNMSGIDPLQIPLKADPGKPPSLAEGWGHISISHCYDALLIGWCATKIGVDIERKDRKIQARKLSKRFFNHHEHLEIANLSESESQEKVLQRWVVKEASIKWEGSKISKNLDQWIWMNNSSFAYHKKLGYKIKVYNQTLDKWTFGIALNENSMTYKPIICIH